MAKHFVVLYFFVLLLCVTTYGKRRPPKKSKSNYFDVLIFTQHWPQTVCYKWKESSESHSCELPRDDEWTIHGIWPSKYNTLDPKFCNSSLPFNPAVLKPFEPELKKKWTDIMKGREAYSFWKHEWDKHGTCAAVLEEFNTEEKYFRAALKLLDIYDMKHVLGKGNILPGESYAVQDIFKAVENVLGIRSQIMCIKNPDTGDSYLFEIRICFDKKLQIIDCDGITGFPTNCDHEVEIMYPSQVPTTFDVVLV